MKIKLGFLLTGILSVIFSTAAFAADIHIEGENYSKIDCPGYTVVEKSEFSGGKALFLNSTIKIGKRVWAEYTLNAPQEGVYSVEGITGRYNVYYASNIHFSVNGGAEYRPDITKITDYEWWVNQRGDYCSKYNFGTVRLNKGINTVRLYLAEGNIKVDLPLYTSLVDYLDFTKVSPTFEITDAVGMTDSANVFKKGENVRIKINFSNNAPKNSGFEFVLEDVWEREIKRGKVTFEEGSESYILTLGNLPVCWYRLKFLSGEFSDKLQKEVFFSVVAPLSKASEYNERFALDGGLTFTSPMLSVQRLAKSLKYIGFKQVREGGGDPGYTLEDDSYIPSHSGTLNKYLKESGIDSAGGYASLTWMGYINLPDDLMRAYNMNKKMASYKYGSEYEIWNEQDGSFLFEPADRFSSYFKAAALGVNDGSDSAKAVFGGLAGSGEDPYDRLMLANDVMRYSDYYIYHAHIDSGKTKSKTSYPSGKAKGHILMANAYDNNKPVWMNEGGMSIPVDENGVAYFDSQISQARYYIVSSAQGIALGDDKRCFFRFGYFMENGNTYGCHTKNLNPHVVVNSMSAFNNAVGKGDYKGDLCNLPEGAEGYLFDSGVSDVAVVWCETADTVTFKTNGSLKITDFMGAEHTITPVGGKAEVPISYYPIFVTFEDKADETDYFPANKNLQKAERKVYEENEKIVIQQIWENEDLKKAKSNGYTVDWDEEQKVGIKLYNFNKTEQSGTIRIKTGSTIVDGDILVPSAEVISFKVAPMSFAEYPITVKLPEKAKVGDAGYLMIEGELDDGRALSPSKARFATSNEGRVIDDFIPYEGWDNPDNWDTTNVGNCKAEISYSEEEEALLFDLNFAGKSWAWPKIKVADSEATKGSQGITFKIKNAESGKNNHVNVFTYYDDGTDYWLGMDSHFETGDEWKQVVLPWKSFVIFWSALGAVDTRGYKPEYISSIGIGSDSHELSQKFYVKDFAYYRSDLPSDVDDTGSKLEIIGIEEGGTYSGENMNIVTVKIPENKKKALKVMLNEKDYANYTVEDNTVKIDLSGLERGKYTLEVAAFDEWYDVNTNWVNFYIK